MCQKHHTLSKTRGKKVTWEKSQCQDGGCLSERALLTSISKVFLENVVQLWLQAKPEAVETFYVVFSTLV